jgi:hypothetical protein
VAFVVSSVVRAAWQVRPFVGVVRGSSPLGAERSG